MVEVKALQSSDEMREADRVTVQTSFALMRKASALPGLRARVEWDDAALFEAPPTEEAIVAAVDAAIVSLPAQATLGTMTTVALGGIGKLHLSSDSSVGALNVEFDSYAPSPEASFRRMRRRANNALQ